MFNNIFTRSLHNINKYIYVRNANQKYRICAICVTAVGILFLLMGPHNHAIISKNERIKLTIIPLTHTVRIATTDKKKTLYTFKSLWNRFWYAHDVRSPAANLLNNASCDRRMMHRGLWRPITWCMPPRYNEDITISIKGMCAALRLLTFVCIWQSKDVSRKCYIRVPYVP